MTLRTEAGIAAGDDLRIERETECNEFAGEVLLSPFRSYAASSVSAFEHADAPHQVCHLHSSVVHPWGEDRQDTAEGSADFELAAKFSAARGAPGQARRMVVAALRRRGYGDTLVQDAALVLTELSANAVLHAGSPFSVSVSSEDSTLRIAVGDSRPLDGVSASHGLIPHPGRGLGLIEAVSACWGTAAVSGGKIVWAELRV